MLPALMLADELELAVNVNEPDSARAPVTETVPVAEPPAQVPADSVIALAANAPLPGVYVLLLLLMVTVPPTLTVPEPAMKSPPLRVSPPEVVMLLEPDTLVAPLLIVIEAIVEEPPPTVVSTETLDPMTTAAPLAFASTPGIHFVPPPDPVYVHWAFPVQAQRLPLFQLLLPPDE